MDYYAGYGDDDKSSGYTPPDDDESSKKKQQERDKASQAALQAMKNPHAALLDEIKAEMDKQLKDGHGALDPQSKKISWKDDTSRHPQKYNVLDAVSKYLNREITLPALKTVVDNNDKFDKTTIPGKESDTKKLLVRALQKTMVSPSAFFAKEEKLTPRKK